MLGFCLTPAFTQLAISPSRTNPEGSLCCPVLYLVYFPQDKDHFHCGCGFSLALLWTRRQGRADWVRLLICSRWHHLQLHCIQKAVCIVTTGASPPQGCWSVEAPHSEVGCFSAHSCNGPSSVSPRPRVTSRPSSLYSRLLVIGLTWALGMVPASHVYTTEVFSGNAIYVKYFLQWPVSMTSVKVPVS